MKKSNFKRLICLLLALCLVVSLITVPAVAAVETGAESSDDYDGSQLWLNYRLVKDSSMLDEYISGVTAIVVQNYDANPTYRHSRNGSVWTPQQPSGSKETIPATSLEAARLELARAAKALLGKDIPYANDVTADGAVVVGTSKTSSLIASLGLDADLAKVGNEGYVIRSVKINGKNATAIAGNTEIGALYGTYTFLRQMQTQKTIKNLNIADKPKVNHRRLNNWDTERLYAGTNATGEGSSTGGDGSIFCFSSNSNSDRLPQILDRYITFARACASVGINEITINNVNADYAYLSESYILMEAALADVLRPYGVHIGLSVRYVSPTQSGCNTSADTQAGGPSQISGNDANNPYAEKFQNWWTKKTEQIRSRIPDFVGYTVKANSEGQPGPQDYGYDHGDGAYGLGQALAKVNDGMENKMTLFWRTFVYNANVDTDRLKRAYMEFKPINDDPNRSFGDNVFVQTKNGPLDFQGREPVHPMFGAMDKTNQAIEVQITQEYTGHHVSLCYLGTEWEEIFKTDTYANGEGTLVGEVLDGTAQGQIDTAIVGVNNIGNSPNMCGNDFSQANFFSFGRQAWDWTLNAEDIAEDWTRMTWSNDDEVVETIVAMMMGSYEALVSYQTPYGVGHQMTGTGTHYFPNPAQLIVNGGTVRDDWSPAYYSRVDGVGVGYNRTGHTELASSALQMGSNLAGQYSDYWEEIYNDMDATPENQILWFHHVPWDYEMDDGRTFWEDAVYLMQMGVQFVSWMRDAWASLEGKIDQTRYNRVADKLFRQEIDASEWRDFYSSYWQANNNLDKPVDDGALSIAVTIGGKEYKGFDLSVDSFNKTRPGNLPSSDSRYSRYNSAGGNIADASGSPFSNMFVAVPKEYTISLPSGSSRQISKVEFLNKDYADGTIEILSNDDQQAQVKVTREGPFGMLAKTYNFKFADDATLAGIKANDIAIESFDPDTVEYAVMCGDAVINAPYITAEATDPAASVKVKQADAIPGKATITVKNGDVSKTYTVNFARSSAFTENFDGSAPSADWTWVRENASNWSMANGALTISTANGDIKGSGNNAQNVLLHDVGTGDWVATTKLTFSAIPSQVTQQGALIVYQDDNNFFKVNVEHQNSGAAYRRASAGIERSGSYSDVFYDALETEESIAAANNTIWLKIVKTGNTYRAYWATDGNAAYKALGECTANFKEPKIGALAVSGNSNASIKVSYDNITVTDHYALLITEDGGEHPDEPDEPTPGPTNTQHIDFTDPASASLIQIENQANTEIREGEGLYLVSTTDAFEPCNGQISTFAPKDVVKIPAEGDWKATMKLNFNQGSSQGYYEFFGFYAMDDYENCVGIRAGDGAIQDFLSQDGTIVADTDGVKTSSGLKSSAIHWFRIEKTGDSYACFWSVDGEEFTPIFSYEATGIEGNTICLDAYSGMATGYNYTVEYLDIEREAQGLPSIDFTDSASEGLFQIVNPDVSEIREGEGLYMITTKDGFEDANGQLSGDAATTPKDLVLVPVSGDWTATLTFDFSQAGASNGYYQFFGFYAMQDYNNAAGIRGGDGAMQDFLRIDGAVTAETMNSTPGLASDGTYYYRIVKEGTTYTCFRSSDGENFEQMFAYENTGIEAENIAIDAYTGMTAGYTFLLKSLVFEGGSAPQHEHKYTAVVTAPTCTAKGFTTYTCACGDSYVADEVAALGHDYRAETTAATCTEPAGTTYTCSRCGDHYTEAAGGFAPITDVEIIVTCPSKYNDKANEPTIIKETYFSKTTNCNRNANVQLPPNYSADKKYPVMFVNHGIGGNQDSMLNYRYLFNNLMLDDTMPETIIVYCDMFAAPNGQGNRMGFNAETMRYYDAFPKSDLPYDLLPYIISKYPVKEGKENTAVCGFSQGGRESMAAGLFHPEIFGYIGGFSPAPGIVPGKDSYMTHEGTFQESEVNYEGREAPYLTMICCGSKDSVVGQFPASYDALYTKNGIAHVWWEISGSDHGDPATSSGIYNFCRYVFKAAGAASEPLGHDLKESRVEATCTAEGSITKACTRCDYKEVTAIPALGHDFVDGKCTRCGEVYVEELVNYALQSNGGSAVASDGIEGDVNNVIDGTRIKSTRIRWASDNLPATLTIMLSEPRNISIVDVISQVPDAIESGITEMGETTNLGLKAITVSYSVDGSNWTVFATGDSNNNLAWQRFEKSAPVKAQYIKIDIDREDTFDGWARILEVQVFGRPLGADVHTHQYTKVVTEPTCTAKGYTTYTCECGDSYVGDEVAALGHDVKESRVEATCTEAGSITKTCSRCDYKEVTEISALGHDVKEITVDATCTAAGSVTKTCSRCDYKEVTEIPALDHNYVNGKCARCGEKDPDYVCDGGEACPAKAYTDAPKPGSWAHAGIVYCIENGLMNGMSKTLFKPNGTVTRGQLVTILYRIANEPAFTADVTFTDVEAGRYYTNAVKWAAENDIVNGYIDGTFKPEAPISREQIATILYRYAGKPAVTGTLDFPDANLAGNYAKDALVWATQEGLITGVKTVNDTILDPKANATRAQIATIIMRYLESN